MRRKLQREQERDHGNEALPRESTSCAPDVDVDRDMREEVEDSLAICEDDQSSIEEEEGEGDTVEDGPGWLDGIYSWCHTGIVQVYIPIQSVFDVQPRLLPLYSHASILCSPSPPPPPSLSLHCSPPSRPQSVEAAKDAVFPSRVLKRQLDSARQRLREVEEELEVIRGRDAGETKRRRVSELGSSHPHLLTPSPPPPLTLSSPHSLTSSPPHSLTSSPPHSLTSSPPHTLISSPPHLIIPTPPLLLILSPPHLLTPHLLLTPSLPHPLTSSSPPHSLTLSLPHPLTSSSPHLLIPSPHHPLTSSSPHLLIPSPHHPLTPSPLHPLHLLTPSPRQLSLSLSSPFSSSCPLNCHQMALSISSWPLHPLLLLLLLPLPLPLLFPHSPLNPRGLVHD